MNPIRLAGLAALCLAGAVRPAAAADQALIDAAKKEGKVTWYTTAIVDQLVRPAVAAFEKKYGIHVDYSRASTAELELRVISEARAGKMLADVVDGTTTSIVLRKEGMIEKWIPRKDLPARYIDPDGYWEASNEYVLTPGYNTDLVPKGSEPKNWQDLLDPRWKGRMAWNATPSSSSGQGFVGLVLMELGEQKGRAYLAKLAKQDIHAIKTSARQVLNQVIAGEYAIGLEIFNNHTTISRARGAPVNWLKINPALAVVLPMSVTKGSPHPNAGKLLFDFILSDEGQRIVAKAGELPVLPSVPPLVPDLRPGPGNFRAIYLPPDKLQAAIPGWTKVYDEYFR
jgi:iron(III) transport system substrate-binding protein